ncbi:hypothetical protein [Crateriforma conspicua]|uniref:Uncharacterized protein n=1 Tax=Crateriforma conspicua TaxID=2527996 RepID=A0A5C5XSK4_9PLAN|nr:hypothetical protein [Crateriforma conspicua]TWT65648.1 hypothetical protein Pan14r_51960 [Crateriforma conspicua]
MIRNKVDRINNRLAAGAYHREQLEAIAAEMIELHGEMPTSCAADELEHVIRDGASYEDAMRRIINWKLDESRETD